MTRKTEELRYSVAIAYHSEIKTNLLVRDQNLYDIPLPTLLQSSDDALIAWLKEHQLARRDRDEFFQSHASQSATLRTWMIPKRGLPTTRTPANQKRLKLAKNDQEWSQNRTIEDLRRGSWNPP